MAADEGKTPLPEREKNRPNRLRPLRTQHQAHQEAGRELGPGLTAIDNPDDADIYPPTETPTQGRKRRKGIPRQDR